MGTCFILQDVEIQVLWAMFEVDFKVKYKAKT